MKGVVVLLVLAAAVAVYAQPPSNFFERKSPRAHRRCLCGDGVLLCSVPEDPDYFTSNLTITIHDTNSTHSQHGFHWSSLLLRLFAYGTTGSLCTVARNDRLGKRDRIDTFSQPHSLNLIRLDTVSKHTHTSAFALR